MELLTAHPERRPDDALDRLLALRPEDVDGWEDRLASRLPAADADRESRRDAALTTLLDRWDHGVRPRVRSAEDILAFVSAHASEPQAEESPQLPDRRSAPSWALTAGVAAALVALGAGLSWLRPEPDVVAPATEAARWKGGPLPADNRLDLLFSVEREADRRVVVEVGKTGAVYAPRDGLAIRADLRGDGGFFYLYERTAGGVQQLWPEEGESLRLAPGLHELRDTEGVPLVYRPEPGATGEATYLALVARQPLDGETVAETLLGAGLDTPTGWPAVVIAADAFEVRWSE